jgi:hypothetical protein
MSKAKVKEKQFNKRPILFLVSRPNKVNLYFLHFLEQVRNLKDDDEFHVAEDQVLSKDVED